MSRADRASERRSETRPALQRKRRPTIKASSGTPLVFGHFRRGTNVKPEVDAWIAASRLAFWRHLPQREGRHSFSDGGLGYSVRPLRGHRKMSKLQSRPSGTPRLAWLDALNRNRRLFAVGSVTRRSPSSRTPNLNPFRPLCSLRLCGEILLPVRQSHERANAAAFSISSGPGRTPV